MAVNESQDHHYVPQFYLRRFACADDANKVMTVERDDRVIVVNRRSIGSIGFEKGLHKFVENGASGSFECEIERAVETPFTQSETWKKIKNDSFTKLDENDGLAIYGFARHLQSRNAKTLRFIEAENARFLDDSLQNLTDQEREMHEWLAATPGAAHQLFREGALDTDMPEDAPVISIMLCKSPIPLRTSTNPTLMISRPGRKSVFGEMFNSLRTWWLSLDRHWGAFIIAGGPSGFSSNDLPEDAARVINRQYFTQMAHGDARFMLAEDQFLKSDLQWAGYAFEKSTKHGFRYRQVTT